MSNIQHEVMAKEQREIDTEVSLPDSEIFSRLFKLLLLSDVDICPAHTSPIIPPATGSFAHSGKDTGLRRNIWAHGNCRGRGSADTPLGLLLIGKAPLMEGRRGWARFPRGPEHSPGHPQALQAPPFLLPLFPIPGSTQRERGHRPRPFLAAPRKQVNKQREDRHQKKECNLQSTCF